MKNTIRKFQKILYSTEQRRPNTHRHPHGTGVGVEVSSLSAKHDITQLSKGKEDYEKHDGKTTEVFGTGSQRAGELSHGFVEADILEDLWWWWWW